jgi:lipoprotein-releasing system ATP-binding protein
MGILETNKLSKYFYDPVKFQALKDISISVERGEFVSIIGSSGSGKSTLLYVLSTLDSEYEGQIFLEGEDLSKKSKNELAEIRNEKIGFVFQFHYLLPEFTVLENVMLPALKLGRKSIPEVEEAAMEKLKMLNVEDQAMKKANKLSGGQQQRVAIARALINNPKIIFGDEPTGNLDSKNSKMVFDILSELKINHKQTILIVTHDLDFASKTDRSIQLADGEVIKN